MRTDWHLDLDELGKGTARPGEGFAGMVCSAAADLSQKIMQKEQDAILSVMPTESLEKLFQSVYTELLKRKEMQT